MSEKGVEAIRKWTFQKRLFLLSKWFLNSNGIFLFNKMISKKINKYEQIQQNQEIFQKTGSIKDIKFNSFQRKPMNTLNYASMRQQGCLSFLRRQVISKTLQQVIEYENNNKDKQNPKNQ